MELKTVETPHVPVRYLTGGSGPALVYLHGAGGVTAADPLLAELAKSSTVYAPFLPGYGDSQECAELRDMLDITLHYWDVVAALGLKDPVLVGHSMGGMIAAEMAAVAPGDVSRLGLICPAGLWLDDHPIADLFSLLPYELPQVLFHDPEAGAKAMSSGLNMEDPGFLQTFLVQNARQLGMAGRILFPIPDRGLSGRIYRVKAKTVLVWGDSDRLIPPVYAQAWKRALPNAELVSVPEAGHMITIEKPADVAAALSRLG
ncbi:pimeloyl-ACP methyl ester carboxylesterase [Caulobacter ginsengisoli]|uniref:Pimeloyl-ACP methyl ester carboxylesterase n=1 Tax=Caulobacter ginsengisoli TaxID=400775 RepID=A0ABU0INF7_9CAUL|nr:alpha/beta hydrolase [Caulobacter ginsengisoli]MDQ0462554.1 pimeloyl-ACP methyl ester carboxylesterase [Caulobacter ginsengisoli]